MVRWVVKWLMEGLLMGAGLFIMFAVFAVVIGYLGFTPENDAMKVCQLSHSHDVCFQTLNR